VLNEQFIDRRTRAVLRRDAEGQLVAATETTDVSVPIVDVARGPGGAASVVREGGEQGTAIESVEEHTARAEEQLESLQVELARRSEATTVAIPRLKMTPIRSEFSLADITDRDTFRKLGDRIAADPVGQLWRIRIGARVIEGPDGLRRTELVPTRAIDRVESPAELLPREEVRQRLVERVLNAPVVPARANQRAAVAPIIDAFMKGLGDQSEKILSGYMDRAAAGLIQLITEEQRNFAAKPSYGEVVEVVEFNPTRIGRPLTTKDRVSAFKRGVGYEGYRRSMFAQEWFDSSTERDVANVLDDSDELAVWARLQTGDLPILWTDGGREYNPDFIAVEKDGVHWLVEVKMDKEMRSEDVKGKRTAAQRWANYVSADELVRKTWRYLLVSETDVKTARGSWDALKKLGE
jgi:type III restriction enzyme